VVKKKGLVGIILLLVLLTIIVCLVKQDNIKDLFTKWVAVLILAGVLILSSDLLFASAGGGEDDCYSWFNNGRRQRPDILNYCTDHMMDCLANCN
jgi:NADH:ubiquinone oxidoreductase subunit 5 (subunit L)/multisubunit Na+/H+ antiporter MnhA subunit